MDDTADDSSSPLSDDSSATPKQSSIRQSKTTDNQADYHYFDIRCLSEKKTLKGIIYTSVDDIKKSAFDLYEEGGFNDDNAILTYLDNNNVEVLLTSVPNLLKKSHCKDLFIRFVHPVCAMCSNPFGIIESQRLLQCPRVKCGIQYCSNCVQAIQGSPPIHPFVCITCKKNVIPQRNMLIEEHIIWKNMCKLYGTQSLLDLKKDSNKKYCYPILQNTELRLTHLRSRLATLRNKADKEKSIRSDDEQLINNVNGLCTKLEDLVTQMKKTDQEMEDRNIIVSVYLENYRKRMKHFDRLCDTLIKAMMKLQTLNNNIMIDITDPHKEHIKQLYRMNNLDTLPFEQNIKSIDAILEDVVFRRKCLLPRLETVTSLLKDKPDETKLLENDLKQAKKNLEIINSAEQDLNDLRKNLQTIECYTDKYDKLLRDDQFQDIPCSKFILLFEMMRVRTEELEISNHFPQTTQLMEAWQNEHGTGNEFKPKVIDLFKTVEKDMKDLLTDENCIYSLPYKIGVIGDGSVGKTALTMNLANVNEFSSMVAAERSTFSYLQFDTLIYKDPCSDKIIPVTFVDIEGATDTDQSQSTGNYIELINKADCDMYIIVFDRFFSDHNRDCQDYIENKLRRKCLLVRTKADLLFNQWFRQMMGKNYKKTPGSDYQVNAVLSEIKNHALKTFDDKRLDDNVYLTAVACDDDLKGACLGTFDLDKLRKKLIELAITDFRGQRICGLAVRAAITVINTCFRRGYVVSKTQYKWLAAGFSIIPFLDELPAFFGREKIRQAFGIHDSFAVTNAVRRTKDSFEEYLMKKTLMIPKKDLKSGEFKYLIPGTAKKTTTTSETKLNISTPQKRGYHIQKKSVISSGSLTSARHTTQNIVGRTTLVLGVVGKVAEAARVVVPTASAALKTVSIASIVVGVVLTPVFAAWSSYSAGKRMNEELHLICDDLMVILPYFVAAACNDCCENIQLPVLPSSYENSSSSDDD